MIMAFESIHLRPKEGLFVPSVLAKIKIKSVDLKSLYN
jgi:hypothetical protein